MDTFMLESEDENDRGFRRGIYMMMPVVAKMLRNGENPPLQQGDMNRGVVNFFKRLKVDDNNCLLYRPFEETFESYIKRVEVLEKYGPNENPLYRFSNRTRTIMLSLVNTIYYAHNNDRAHNMLAGNVFVRKHIFFYGRGISKEYYYAVVANNFTKCEGQQSMSKNVGGKVIDTEIAKNRNWVEVGNFLKKMITKYIENGSSRLGGEVQDLMDVLIGNESACFKGDMAIHSPSLWSNEYQIEFDKWAMSVCMGNVLKLSSDELFIGDWRKHIDARLLNTKQGVAIYREGQYELVRFVRNLSEHPEKFKNIYPAANPASENCKDVLTFVKWKFPNYHLKLVENCIRGNIEQMKHGLKIVEPGKNAPTYRQSQRSQSNRPPASPTQSNQLMPSSPQSPLNQPYRSPSASSPSPSHQHVPASQHSPLNQRYRRFSPSASSPSPAASPTQSNQLMPSSPTQSNQLMPSSPQSPLNQPALASPRSPLNQRYRRFSPSTNSPSPKQSSRRPR